ncbi:hypothetical protein LWC35_36675 [Pseudonocardia kujensis]|uniref:hypothetical protein n=1 Tax=Pseudonocardia kujensis TaxID=1128675 RepID=UPI001E593C64|nr:hypothetical protein [Pseudonocardia kujensis]MCE0768387.1 hypothetical protein [Pseudonocardia kujensis]
MTRQRRVAVTSPQTRVAFAARRGVSAVPRSLSGDELRAAARIRRRQLRVAAGTLAAAALLLVGLPVLLGVVPVALRLGPVPVVWVAVALLPYPVLAGLAHWQLRRAERTEDGAEQIGRDRQDHAR